MLLVATHSGVGFGIAMCGETMKLNAMKRQGRHDDEEAFLVAGSTTSKYCLPSDRSATYSTVSRFRHKSSIQYTNFMLGARGETFKVQSM